MFSWKKKKRWLNRSMKKKFQSVWHLTGDFKKANFPTHVSVCIGAFDFYRTPLFFVEKKQKHDDVRLA